MEKKRPFVILGIALIILSLAMMPLAGFTPSATASQASRATNNVSQIVNDGEGTLKASHRLIVQLESPSLLEQSAATGFAPIKANGHVDLQSPQSQNYINQLKAEQAAFVSTMNKALPDAFVSAYINENNQQVQETYQIVFNGMAIDPGKTSTEDARRTLSRLPGVKAVYPDYSHQPDLYASIPLINAKAAWDEVGGRDDGGAGIKVASMDGGVHHDAPMFDGTGYSYPAGYPAGGLGLTANNNGKIIASRVYFRTWDPPSEGDENPWPGVNGTSHGNHTAGIAAGDVVSATYAGADVGTISGVAPKAWIMSYRVFYNSITNDGSFYNAEGIAALEDIVQDEPDVLNNSWGGGPGSVGGEFDPLDMALINASESGIFVSMSAGNAGPGNGTTDHPSDNYINVAASSTDGTFAAGRLNIIEPTPIEPDLQAISFTGADFGAPLPIGEAITYTYKTAASVDSANVEGCDPWPADAFTGYAAVISRGTCEFGTKVLNAEEAGAEFVVIYNHATGGDGLITMGAGEDGGKVTITSIFIGHTDGLGMVDWYDSAAAAGKDAVLEVNTLAFQAGNRPDVLASFSSRGPGVGNVLKPDITAPGVNIISQGFTPGATGEARHLGFGQASGTSMAAPHVAGAAALLRQIHPSWTNAEIKSSLMSTSKYIGIFDYDGTPAQPLQMGAGRLDLTNAADPGVILDPPSLSFGQLITGTAKTIAYDVTNVYTATETYTLATAMAHGSEFAVTEITEVPGFSIEPTEITLDPGETETISVTFDTAAGTGIGDNQGYIVMEGEEHEAHLPSWARVAPEPTGNVLIIQNDFSYLLGYPDYLSYYEDTLDELGISYDVWNADEYFDNPTTIPDAATLSAYDAVIYFTGDNYYPDGSFTQATPLTSLDMDILTQYANNGGILIAMGQDLTSVMNSTSESSASFLYQSILGGKYLQDSVSNFDLPNLPVVPLSDAPSAFHNMSIDLSGPETFLGAALLSVDNEVLKYIYLPTIAVSGGAAVQAVEPALATADAASGTAGFTFDVNANRLDYNVQIEVTEPMTISTVGIYRGAAGSNGPLAYPLLSEPTLVTETLSLEGALIVADDDVDALLAGNMYLNVFEQGETYGLIRGQILLSPVGDGAANQYYVDEIAAKPFKAPDNPAELMPYMPLLKYPGMDNVEAGIVAMSHRDQPTLERPGISYFGRSIYTSFGLEGVNDGVGMTSRAELLGSFTNWAMDEPTVVISDVTPLNDSHLTMFKATLSSNITDTVGVSYRWDFGDETDYTPLYASSTVGHVYEFCGPKTVRVEAVDSWGNRTIGELEVTITDCAVEPHTAAP